MKHSAVWKALILGAALTGFGLAGAGTAAAAGAADSPPLSVAPISADGIFDDLDDLHDVVGVDVQIPWGYVAFDDDADDDQFDD